MTMTKKKVAKKKGPNSIQFDLQDKKAILQRKGEGLEDVQLHEFKILQQLGQGGFGRVYLAELESDSGKKLFAVKNIRKDKLVA